jgi:hypothetical protein
VPGQTFNVFLGAFNVAWEIDIWGRIRRSTEVAQAQYLANDEARRGVVVTLVSEVASNYFQLLELDRELAIAHESAETYRQTLDVFTKRYRGGTDTKISTSRAEANLHRHHRTLKRRSPRRERDRVARRQPGRSGGMVLADQPRPTPRTDDEPSGAGPTSSRRADDDQREMRRSGRMPTSSDHRARRCTVLRFEDRQHRWDSASLWNIAANLMGRSSRAAG